MKKMVIGFITFATLVIVGAIVWMVSILTAPTEMETDSRPLTEEEWEARPTKEPTVIVTETPTQTETPIPTEEPTPVPKYIAYDDVPLDEDLQIAMQHICDEKHVNFEFAVALMISESNGNTEAVGDSGRSVGLFQIRKDIWADYMMENYGLDLDKPVDNIEAGVRLIAEYIETFETVEGVVMAYKCGSSRAIDLMADGVYLPVIDEIARNAMTMQQRHQLIRDSRGY